MEYTLKADGIELGVMVVQYQVPYLIRLKDGTEVMAMLLKLNKHCGKKVIWKRLDNVPRKKRYIEPNKVVAIAAWKK